MNKNCPESCSEESVSSAAAAPPPDINAVVVDAGSGWTRAGHAGDDAPRAVFPTCLGVPRWAESMLGVGQKDTYVGDEAQSKRGVLDIVYPVEHGVVQNWEQMQKVLHHTFYNEIRIAPEEHNLLMVEPPLNPRTHTEKLAEVMFETYDVPGFYVATSSILTMYASGRTTGLAVDCGDGVTSVVPVSEGYAVRDAAIRLDFGGRELTKFISKILGERDIKLVTSAQLETARDIKDKLAYVAEDFDAEMRASQESGYQGKEYQMPDGKPITVGSEMIRCGEVLFRPYWYSAYFPLSAASTANHHGGIVAMVTDSIAKCEPDTRRDLYSNIVLSGGTTMLPHLQERLLMEVQRRAPESAKVKVVAPPERRYSVWIGGSILGSLSTFQGMWITKTQYDEVGPSVMQKCVF